MRAVCQLLSIVLIWACLAQSGQSLLDNFPHDKGREAAAVASPREASWVGHPGSSFNRSALVPPNSELKEKIQYSKSGGDGGDAGKEWSRSGSIGRRGSLRDDAASSEAAAEGEAASSEGGGGAAATTHAPKKKTTTEGAAEPAADEQADSHTHKSTTSTAGPAAPAPVHLLPALLLALAYPYCRIKPIPLSTPSYVF